MGCQSKPTEMALCYFLYQAGEKDRKHKAHEIEIPLQYPLKEHLRKKLICSLLLLCG
jgi:hypothetical protein